jgi:PAS domain S-box-containing protein
LELPVTDIDDSGALAVPVTVLLVDDRRADLVALRTILEPLEIELLEATSGKQAIELAASRPLAAILLDVQMPGQDGFETAKRIRENSDGKRVPIIFLTAYGNDEFPVIQAYRLGAIDYLVKPLIPEILRTKVLGFVELFRHTEQIRRQSHLLEEAERRQRERIESALRDSEERHRIWVKAVKDFAIFLMDEEGRITSWNEGGERLTGYLADEVIGQSFARLFIPQDQDADKPQLELETAAATGSANDENWIQRKDGSRFWASGFNTALRDDDGRLRGFVKIIHDLTERKLFEDRLRKHAAELTEAARRRDQFLAMLSHELRNPLGPIRNAVQLLQQRGNDAEVLGWAREVIERQARHMTRLVDDLLDVTRVARGKVTLDRQRVDLGRLVLSTTEDYRPGILQAGLNLVAHVPENPVWIVGDSTRLSQVLGNLLDNARKFSDPGGEIDVRLVVDHQNARAEIVVHDTGIGMTQDLLRRIFEIFEQGQHGLDRTRGGLGVGLALVKAIVEMHGGEVRASSDGPGKGATFFIVLPLAQASGGTLNLPLPGKEQGKSLSIVIIEDNDDARQTQKMLLEGLGHQVAVAANGPQGIELARQIVPDVVLCDIGLPGMDGYQVGCALRADPNTAQVRLIAISGYCTEADFEKSRHAGFDLHLTKPVDPGVLANAIQSKG